LNALQDEGFEPRILTGGWGGGEERRGEDEEGRLLIVRVLVVSAAASPIASCIRACVVWRGV
jgi:hypothetical protein